MTDKEIIAELQVMAENARDLVARQETLLKKIEKLKKEMNNYEEPRVKNPDCC